MSKRINIILPDEAITVLNRSTQKGGRSAFIAQALFYYAATQGQKTLNQQLQAGYIANSKGNLEMAEEWFHLEDEAANLADSSSEPRGK